MMSSMPRKRVRSSEGDHVNRDRLSEMPDEVLVNILSCMETLDAVRTVLLRPFGNLWTLTHTLEFDTAEYIYTDQKPWVHRFVRNVLMLHQKSSLDRFNLTLRFDEEDEEDEAINDVKIWFRFALDRQAKEIRLFDRSIGCRTMCLPKLTSRFLVTLDLLYCIIEGKIQVKLGSLKKLSLTYVYLEDEMFQSFISGCPSLQQLFIDNPFGMTELSFSAPNIDILSLAFSDVEHREYSLALNIPNLKSLHLDIFFMCREYIMDTYGLETIDVSSVRDIYLRYRGYSMYVDNAPFITKLLAKLEGVEVFRSSLDFSEIFLWVIQNVRLLGNRWKRIVLELDNFCESCLLGICHLMRSLKHFEELIIYTTKNFRASTDLQQVKLPFPYVPPQLKTITLHGYGKTWKSQLLLIEALLKSAAVLDKFVIVLMKHQLAEAEELKFFKHVSSLPKASPNARVIFA